LDAVCSNNESMGHNLCSCAVPPTSRGGDNLPYMPYAIKQVSISFKKLSYYYWIFFSFDIENQFKGERS